MKRIFLPVCIVLAAVALTAAAYSSHAEKWYEGIAQWPGYHHAIASVSSKLADADSAEFRDLYLSKGIQGDAVCGMVNAKNRLGGYVGYRHFYVTGKHFDAVNLQDADQPSPGWVASWAGHCVDGHHRPALFD